MPDLLYPLTDDLLTTRNREMEETSVELNLKQNGLQLLKFGPQNVTRKQKSWSKLNASPHVSQVDGKHTNVCKHFNIM